MGWRKTENYEYNENDVLGRGACGVVLKGRNIKDNDKKVAVKVCNTSFVANPNDELTRRRAEYEWLRTHPHKNIVNVIAIETEVGTGYDVLIMEFCNRGNLCEIISDTENGFNDVEFLRVLKDITAAVKHLRNGNIIHRDIKPANIMKHESENGEVLYKLADFGFARVLESQNEFSTYCGTMQYVHPNIIGKAAFNKQDMVTDENVDLWSLGATFYHLATGKLPFPFKNNNEMFTFTTSKPHGVIAAFKDASKRVVQFTEIPSTSALSPPLRDDLKILLAKLMEVDRSRSFSYEEYFDEVDKILSRN